MKKTLLVIPLMLFVVVGLISVSAESLVPQWIKNTALWYGQGNIADQEYLDSIKYLIKNKIIFLDEEEKTEVIDPTIESENVIISKPRINQCSVLYQAYKNVGKLQFLSKYDHINFINACVKLYHDPVWKYQGDDRVEKLNEKFTELNQKIKEENPKLSYEPTVKIITKTDIGLGKFNVKFNICAGNDGIDKAKVLVKSEVEAIQVGSNKDLPENSCRGYVTQIHAKNPANIQISLLAQVYEN